MSYHPTVFIVDDDKAVCESLRWLLESIQLNVKTFSSGEEFLEYYSVHMVGCLILDVRMPNMSGLQLQKYLKGKYAIPIIFLTGHGDIPIAVQAMREGAFHFLEKPFDDQVFLDYVNLALRKDGKNQKKRLKNIAIQARLDNLTDREREVFALVINNYSNKEVAEKLKVSIKTVEFHRSHMMEKIHAKSLLELVNMTRDVLEERDGESLY